MAKSPPKKPKDPAKPTRAKAARPDDKPTPDALANLLNPGIGRGTAGLGSGTGLQQPPDNSWDRRRDFSEAHKARKSTPKEFNEAPQRNYSASPITGLDPALAQELGLGDDDDASSPSPAGGGSRAEGARGGVSGAEKIHPLPPSGACHRAALRADPLGRRPPPSRGR